MYGWLLDIWNDMKVILRAPDFWLMLFWVLLLLAWIRRHG